MSGTGPLKVDQLARGLFDSAVVAVQRQDAALALEVCRRLGAIESDYELRLRNEEQKTFGPFASVAPTPSPHRGRCKLCNELYNEGDSIRWVKGLGGAHDACAGKG